MKLTRVDKYRLRLEPEGETAAEAMVYLPEEFNVEDEALAQLFDTATVDDEAIVLATPDIHTGFGVPIGTVFASARYVSPCAVGYDVNCGMRLLTTPLAAKDVDIAKLAQAIARDIPLGEGERNMAVSIDSLDRLLAEGVPALASLAESREPDLRRGYEPRDLEDDLLRIEDGGALKGRPACVPEKAKKRGRDQLATLGGGNHFIEIQRVANLDHAELAKAWGLWEGQLVVMLHSGSRGLGHEVGGQFMRRAAAEARRHNLPLPNRELVYMPLETDEADEYLAAMACAANFAFVNRQLMAQLVRRNLRHYCDPELEVKTLYDVPHNIAKFETVPDGRRLCVHRKGATRAFPPSRMQNTPYAATGQPVLIPGSMGTASYVLAGVESGAESIFSVNHGAGRRMSRTAAAGVVRRGKVIRAGRISDEEFRKSMEGIHLICADRLAIKEEAPAAYKDIDAVIDTVVGAGLAQCVARLVPLAVLKG